MNNTANKKDIFYIIVLILTFITVVVGATFAISYFFVDSDLTKSPNAIYTGTFEIEYLTGQIINFDDMTPIEKPTIDTEEKVYKNNFKVANKGSLNGLIDIFIEIEEDTFEAIRHNPDVKEEEKGTIIILKYSLYNKASEEIYNGDIGDYGEDSKIKIASGLELNSNETEEYTLLIWLEDDGTEQKGYMGQKFIGRIRVDATQKTKENWYNVGTTKQKKK